MPCPTRCFFCFCPLGGRRSLRFMALFLYDRQQMRHLGHHAAEVSVVRPLHHAVHFLETQRSHDDFVLFRGADRAADQLDFNFSIRHEPYPTFSCARPRMSATCALSRSCSRALMVALTTLCGLWHPIDLVSTFGMPTACMTARTGPPA